MSVSVCGHLFYFPVVAAEQGHLLLALPPRLGPGGLRDLPPGLPRALPQADHHGRRALAVPRVRLDPQGREHANAVCPYIHIYFNDLNSFSGTESGFQVESDAGDVSGAPVQFAQVRREEDDPV